MEEPNYVAAVMGLFGGLGVLFIGFKILSDAIEKLANEYYLARLVGKLANLVDETEASYLKRMASAKAAIGGDVVTGRDPYGKAKEFVAKMLFVYCLNSELTRTGKEIQHLFALYFKLDHAEKRFFYTFGSGSCNILAGQRFQPPASCTARNYTHHNKSQPLIGGNLAAPAGIYTHYIIHFNFRIVKFRNIIFTIYDKIRKFFPRLFC